MTASWLGILGSVLVVGCGGPSSSRTVSEVDFGHGIKTQTVWTAVDEQEASSGEVGCPPSEIKILDAEGNTWTAICDGKTYFCSYDSGNTSCSQRADDASAKPEPDMNATRRVIRNAHPPSVPAPKGAAGFELGASAEACKTACQAAGNTWEEAEETSVCSGTPEAIGLAAQARLRFCDENLCEIVLVAQPPSSESTSWIDSFAQLSSALEKKYGTPNMERRLIPERCRDAFAECLAQGDAVITYNWVWNKASGVELAMDRATGEPAIRLQYKRLPKSKTEPVQIKSDAL